MDTEPVHLYPFHRPEIGIGKDSDGIACVVAKFRFIDFEILHYLYFGSHCPPDKRQITADLFKNAGAAADYKFIENLDDAVQFIHSEVGNATRGISLESCATPTGRFNYFSHLVSGWIFSG